MVHDGRDVGPGIVGRQVTDRVLVVAQGPDRWLPRRLELFVSQELIDRRAPEVTMAEVGGRQIAAARPVELQDGK